MTALPSPSLATRQSYVTLLRHALHGLLGDDANIRATIGRGDRLVVLPHGINEGQLPVYVLNVSGDQRIGGMGDRRTARVALAAFAADDDAYDIAEGLIALARELITPGALEARGLEYVRISPPTEEDGEPFDVSEVPRQWGRSQLVLDIAATVPPT